MRSGQKNASPQEGKAALLLLRRKEQKTRLRWGLKLCLLTMSDLSLRDCEDTGLGGKEFLVPGAGGKHRSHQVRS